MPRLIILAIAFVSVGVITQTAFGQGARFNSQSTVPNGSNATLPASNDITPSISANRNGMAAIVNPARSVAASPAVPGGGLEALPSRK
jgi:hypothetical protein